MCNYSDTPILFVCMIVFGGTLMRFRKIFSIVHFVIFKIILNSMNLFYHKLGDSLLFRTMIFR